MKLITTSWDDGHPLDIKLAELLDKYNIPGTFYIPKSNQEHEVANESTIHSLAQKFEIGGHTIHHVRLGNYNRRNFESEIGGCYQWLTDLLGYHPASFCFPRGVYTTEGVQIAKKTGFKFIRTTELLNADLKNKTIVFPTTLQVYNHSSFTYYKHLLARFKFRSLGLYINSGGSSHLYRLLEYYLDYISRNGGCFHLWGHSWEIEEFNLWKELEQLLKMLGSRKDFVFVENRSLLKNNTFEGITAP